jgi:acetyl esterase/lipase
VVIAVGHSAGGQLALWLAARKAASRGADVALIEAAESGHFEMIDPDSSTWPLVLEAARQLLGVSELGSTP